MGELWFRIKELWSQGPFLKIVVVGTVGLISTLIIGFLFLPSGQNQTSTSTAKISSPTTNTSAPAVLKTKDSLLGSTTNPNVYGVENSLELSERIRVSLHESGPSNGLEESLEFEKNLPNGTLEQSNIFVHHIEALRTMKNYASIKIIDLMTQSSERSLTLDNLSEALTKQISTAKINYNELVSEIQSLKSELSIHDGLRKDAQNKSLSGFEQFDAKLMYEAMLLSIDEAGTVNELTTKIKLLEKFLGVYDKLAKYLTIKLKFITANRDGLIKGVVVVTVKGSDEDLIMTEDEWRKAIGQ